MGGGDQFSYAIWYLYHSLYAYWIDIVMCCCTPRRKNRKCSSLEKSDYQCAEQTVKITKMEVKGQRVHVSVIEYNLNCGTRRHMKSRNQNKTTNIRIHHLKCG